MIRKMLSVAVLLILFSVAAEGQFNDEFDGQTPESGWEWVRENPAHWSVSGGALLILTERGALNGMQYNNVRNMLLQPLNYQDDFTMDTELRFEPEWLFQNAGLVYYMDDDNYIRVSRGIHDARNTIWLEWESGGETHFRYLETPLPIHEPDLVYRLRLIRREGNVFSASYRLQVNGGEWSGWDAVAGDTIDFPAGQVHIGLQAANGDGLYTTVDSEQARFNWFHFNTGTAVQPMARTPADFRITDVHPSPVSAGQPVVVALTLDRRAELDWRMVDLLGREVLPTRGLGALSTGAHRFVLPTGSLAPGVYLLHMTGGGVRATRRILITR